MALFGYPACADTSGATKEHQSPAITGPIKRSMAFSLRSLAQHRFVASLGCRGLAAQAPFEPPIDAVLPCEKSARRRFWRGLCRPARVLMFRRAGNHPAAVKEVPWLR